ncbi:Spo0E family sporulation regulatory protein-aspartic acid phosphatase [Clostridium sp.]|mgnify:FL=1|uniref:Spo0E family sporulation regulatory protein-aspartic acid phosphatase n=1 Tax=Clostridium sp. TaxID=1506 RepID=UPI002A912B0D|nr:Spo0E family sporulation regulatory protein-aspartic acid phosphatase [Clostridium sp.]MDY6013299.1 Spo0E family sporulation regulatory protein-aspartic acid phosphatase [Clostridium sp.]
MPMEKIQRKIRNRKFLLNLSLKYLSPSNKLIIIISQNLDKYINLYQSNLYKINTSNNNFKKSDDITI